MNDTQSFQYGPIQGFKFGSWPFGKPKMYSHIYFIDGLLVDTGHRNMRREVIGVVSKLPVEQVFITHHHEDHSGNIHAIKDTLFCPVYSSSLCAEMMKNPPSISFAQCLTWGKAKACFDLIPEDYMILTDKYQFQIIPTPGHAVDMACLYEENEGWLFSADLFVKEYIRYFMKSESMKEQIESIKKVLKLDFDVLFCGHNPQFEGGKKKLRRKLQFLEEFYGEALILYKQGNNASNILRAMGLKENWQIWMMSTGELSTLNMIKAVIRDEENSQLEIEKMVF